MFPSSSSSPPSAYSDHFDYRVLMVKRSSKSKFMPNAYVFPGGVVAEADSSGGWLEVKSTSCSRCVIIQLETKVHPKVRNHGEGPY